MKGIAGFYYVDTVGSGTYVCKARGIFRKDGTKPLVGDYVDITVTDEKDREANITEISPRRNELVRPAVANVDQALVIFALRDPDPDPGLLDRFLISMHAQDLPVVICFNKQDLADEAEILRWKEIYGKCGYDVIVASAAEKQGIEGIREILAGKVTVIAGPSGAGKSSVTNLLQKEVVMETGSVSRKLGRGKHTTRHSELIRLDETTYLCDTPGFSSLFLPGMEKEELQMHYPEIAARADGCRFIGCAHIHEPECSVKESVEKGLIPEERYQSYIKMYQELELLEKRRY